MNTIKLIMMGVFIMFLLQGCSSKEPTLKNTKDINKNVNLKVDSLYEKERKNFLKDTMSAPQIPMKTPDKILRVLIMPYVDEDKNLQMQNFHFIKVEEGRWLLGEYLNKAQSDSNTYNKSLTPLEKNNNKQKKGKK